MIPRAAETVKDEIIRECPACQTATGRIKSAQYVDWTRPPSSPANVRIGRWIG
jgi:hypothetical protein